MLHPLPGETQDDALMRRVAERDAAAFKTLVERHASRPHRIAWRMLGNGAEVEDVTQEALLRLWREAPRWRGDGPGVSPWLARVATNICFDRLRSRARDSDEAISEPADPAPFADELISREETRKSVMQALNRLPDRQRAAIVLTYYEELANAAAADVLEMNLKAFESLLLRARKALREMLIEVAHD